MPATAFPTSGSTSAKASSTPDHDGSVSPTSPPFSPITPVLPTASLAPASIDHDRVSPHAAAQAEQIPFPPNPVAISESQNPDAIALRSALSILQIQRQQSLRDMRTLEKQKLAAVMDPEAFARAVANGEIQSAPQAGICGIGHRNEVGIEADGNDPTANESYSNPSFGTIPGPQNIIRSPPINWAKYHVVGSALDGLHEEQTSHPTNDESQRRMQTDYARPPKHVIAAPYRPWVDDLTTATTNTDGLTRKTGK
ncbi:hypothetical protein MMC09_002824 [Bachmanniomyces sp. S44760]|nr:hypothetical protein [Bachmanniomyces sp. S44760]